MPNLNDHILLLLILMFAIAALTCFHVIICLLLIAAIMLSKPTKGGLGDSFSPSLFGKNFSISTSNGFMIRLVTGLALAFLINIIVLDRMIIQKENIITKVDAVVTAPIPKG